MTALNLFYEEPDPDRWFPYDRYLRKIIRRIVRGKQRPGGVMMISINLMRGLDKLGIPYRLNDYNYVKKHPEEIACIIGKPHVLYRRKWKNPILFGSGIFSHPIENANLLKDYPNIKKILVPGPWMLDMFKPWYGDAVTAWPVGIDTEKWSPVNDAEKTIDFIVYDKLNRDRDNLIQDVLNPVLAVLQSKNLSYQIIRYGDYNTGQLKTAIDNSKAAIFLSESETQGLAYQQILSADLPILAWDHGGYWQDSYYYPHMVKFKPVSSVPYWDERCGIKFKDMQDFNDKLSSFLNEWTNFKPRAYILDNLTLEKCAALYMGIYNGVKNDLN